MSTTTSSNPSPSQAPSSSALLSRSTPGHFPVGVHARRNLRRALASSTDPAATIATYQSDHSLHVMMSRALGTRPKMSTVGGGAASKVGGEEGTNDGKEAETDGTIQEGGKTNNTDQLPPIEPFDPTPALSFLHHLAPTLPSSSIHSRLASTLLSTLLSDIERTPLTNSECVDKLLELLRVSWKFVNVKEVKELRMVVASLVRKLGESTPRELLVRLAEREVVAGGGAGSARSSAGNGSAGNGITGSPEKAAGTKKEDDKDNDGSKESSKNNTSADNDNDASEPTITTQLKHAALLSQFNPPMRRLVYEADWEANHPPSGSGSGGAHAASPSPSLPKITPDPDPSGEGTLTSPNVLADLLRPCVREYCDDDGKVKKNADVAFVQSVRERRVHTVGRRVVSTSSSSASASASASASGDSAGGGGGGGAASATTAPSSSATGLAALTGVVGGGSSKSASSATGDKKASGATKQHKAPSPSKAPPASSAHAVSKIREIIGDRPKLLGALMNMLIAEHGGFYRSGDSNSIAAANNTANTATGTASGQTILGGSSYLHCTLAADVLLTYKQLPRQYEHVGILAKILDGSVRSGVLTDDAVAQIQGCLRIIFQQHDGHGTEAFGSLEAAAAKAKHEAEAEAAAAKAASSKGKSASHTERDDSDYMHKLLRKIVTAAVRAMREADPRGLFLNPVTDDIAPGYSKVIEEPMCIRTIEEKAEDLEYDHLNDYERDVRLMFANCIKYNIGREGTWFRGEARRQEKLWKNDILPQARELFKKETSKRRRQLERADQRDEEKLAKKVETAEERKRRADKISKALKDASGSTDDNAITKLKGSDVDPLVPSKAKRRKKDMDYPSMPCIATMLLSDPFVVRILLDRVLRSVRADVLARKSLPVAHTIVPSLLQLLYLSQFSLQLCSVRGKRFIVPDAGLMKIEVGTENLDPVAAAAVRVPFASLRQYLPLLAGLLLQCDLDRRVAAGGDLHDASASSLPSRPASDSASWQDASSLSALRALTEGAMIHLIQPGQSTEAALSAQLPRFCAALAGLSGGNLGADRSFYISLSQALLRYKRNLSHGTRDLVMAAWIEWIRGSDMCAPVHACFMALLNEWTHFGNIVLPRDTMLSFSEEAAKASSKGDKNFALKWKYGGSEFAPVKKEYERMLAIVSEPHLSQWKEKVGIDDASLDSLSPSVEGGVGGVGANEEESVKEEEGKTDSVEQMDVDVEVNN